MMLPEDLSSDQELIAILLEEPAAANHQITFHQTPETRFYMCSNLSCRNHVVSSENLLRKLRRGILCHSPVNVDLDARRFLNIVRLPIVDVYCNVCERMLGHKLILVGEPTRTVWGGIFTFYLKRMLYWNGSEVVYAETNQPVENS